MIKKDYDAIVVGSGPNGLAAAIVLQQTGLSVLLVEGEATVGGGLRSGEITIPGYLHDICSAVHPFAVLSPFFRSLPLQKHGLEFIFPPLAAAHPFEDGSAAVLSQAIEKTAASLGGDADSYQQLLKPLVEDWEKIAPFILQPFSIPAHPIALAKFGALGFSPVTRLARNHFRDMHAQGLLAGMAAHAVQPLTNIATSAIALIFLLLGHTGGWPIPKGGSQKFADALASYFLSLGGEIHTNFKVSSLEQLPSSHALILDVTPRQLLQIAGHKLSSIYRWQLKRFRYGMGVFKMDWALDGPIPFSAGDCKLAGTIHLGNTLKEIQISEKQIWDGQHPEHPFVLLVQPSMFDGSRAPEGKHIAWAYCHVPSGSRVNMTEAIENQVERFAPGFRDRILARHVMNTEEIESYNPNNVGGDIGGGVQDIGQLFTRPALRFSPYRSSSKGLYICSSSTPPGGGVHGMCGYHAAKKVLRDIFKHGQ